MIICHLTFSVTPGGGSARGRKPGRRGRVCKAHNDTWCQRACVHDGAVLFLAHARYVAVVPTALFLFWTT